ncbi:MAG: AAA family ATPase [Candidatus Acidiferrum sp.]
MSVLTEQDYSAFSKLTIPDSIVDRAAIFRVSRSEAAEKYGIHLDCDGGICFPHFLPPLNGNDVKHPVAYSVRQDAPKYDSAGKPERKYLTTAGRQYPYVAPIALPHWFAEPSVPVIIVEAQKSALAVLRWAENHDRRFIPIGIAGCYGWRGKVGISPNENGEREEVKGLNPGLAAICQNHRVYILLDQNAAANPHVQRGREWLAETLLKEGITNDVRILNLPPSITAPHWNGPDDFLAAAGDEAFQEIFEEAQRFQPNNWESAFHKISELAAGDPEWIIEGYVEEGLSFLGAKSGVAKTWLGISEAQALRTGQPFLAVFPIPKKRNVLYLIPEMTERRFRSRCERLGVDINDPGFLVRTMSDGAPLPLNDPALCRFVEKFQPVTFLDTAIRFGAGKQENDAGEVSHGLIIATYQLVKLGAPSVRALHHRAKESSDDELTLENVLRGSGDFGAGAVCVWGAANETALRAGKLDEFDAAGKKKSGSNEAREKFAREYLRESKKLGRCYLECVKPGDRDLLLWDFRIQLKPSIDQCGKIEMLTTAMPVIDKGPMIDDLLTQKPNTTWVELGKLLDVYKNTAARRARERGWTQNEQTGLWERTGT